MTKQRLEGAVDQSHQKLRVESLNQSIFRTQSLCNARDRPPARGRRISPLLLLYQRTSAFRKRSEGLLSRGGSDQLVVIPRPFGFGRLLDLEQIGRVNLAAGRADRARAEQRIVGRHRL